MLTGISAVWMVLSFSQFPPQAINDPPQADAIVIQEKLKLLNERLLPLKEGGNASRRFADVAICAKAAEWIVRHREFFEPTHSQWTIETLDRGLARADELSEGKQIAQGPGSTVLGYVSAVDGSVQPYAVTFPEGYDANLDRLWPLHVELHGRNAKLNEVSFFHQFEGKPPKKELQWIQLDVFGRTNNAYRWAGETDVFEALAALKQRVRIDENRIVLRGFSMGGAGAWHLGMHHPSVWSAVGAGAGFVDTVHHLKLSAPLSPLHQKLTKIYDAQEYALNAFDVPAIGYGGELDPQLFAAKTMHARGQELGVPIELLVGPGTAHQFHPDSLRQFMAFLNRHNEQGRPIAPAPTRLKFVTYTLKYNRCHWLTIEEQERPYEATTVEADLDTTTKTLTLRTQNAAMLSVPRDVAVSAVIDGGVPLKFGSAGDNSSPRVYLVKRPAGWSILDSASSQRYDSEGTADGTLRKQHNLQGPIDDVFMQPFVCVRPTRTFWSSTQAEWTMWNLKRFEQEFDHRLRAKIQIVDDTQVTDELIRTKNLVLFGDPGSNQLIAKIVGRLPVKWSQSEIEFGGRSFSANDHAVVMVYPNPLNPRKYVVLNSGHTFHEAEFSQSNANLFPRLGDFAVLRISGGGDTGFRETVLFSDLFDGHWRFDGILPQ